MASRIVPQQQHKGEGRNRRALLDIGNLVTLKGVEVKPNRPVTRSFCAQLLANAETSLCQWRFILSFTILSTSGTWFGELCYSTFFIHSFFYKIFLNLVNLSV
ncbi:unnamed protein product [Trifolium pratense]|uniref:Uncharacterized protein n=1 Tax=Trifolium pratense TaxID=57577 RepID=A0ACB0MAE1_TRIPR|nr:unnamed protein product [Trifolium pratense]